MKQEIVKTTICPRLRTCTSSRRNRRSAGFTLIEITVVLAIAAIVTSITVGAFHEMRHGHKRTSCQTNMVQIYQALRLYAADEGGGLPFYDAAGTTDYNNDGTVEKKNIGLWALYTFPVQHPTLGPILPNGTASNLPVERYLRSSKVLHCPNDYDINGENHTRLYIDETATEYNPLYLSYQTMDEGTPTYQSVRTTDKDHLGWKRQLLHFDEDTNTLSKRPPADSTIITWCKWHRDRRDFDNVLFYDGTVQLRPTDSVNWLRDPKAPA